MTTDQTHAASATTHTTNTNATCTCRFPSPPNERESFDATSSSTTFISAAPVQSAAEPPLDQFLCLEYPGFVENIQKAIENVKGEEKIRKVLVTSDSLLQLHYRPHASTTAHPLYGEVHRNLLTEAQPPTPVTLARKQEQQSNQMGKEEAAHIVPSGEHSFDFVMKVTRKRRKKRSRGDGEESKEVASVDEVKAEFLGQISTSITFPGLCDFQLLHSTAPEIELDLPQFWPQHTGATSSAVLRECFQPNRVGDCQIAPLLFSRYDYPREYNFVHHENINAAFKAAQLSQSVLPTSVGGAESKTPSKPPTIVRPLAHINESEAEEEKSIAAAPATAPKKSTKRPRETTSPSLDAEGGAASEEEEELEEAGEDATAAGSAIKRGRKARRYFVGYTIADVPGGPEPGSAFAEPSFQNRAIVKQLHLYFESRPIWSTDALVVRLDEDAKTHPLPSLTRQELLHHLVAVAFRFSGGPWRNLWLRYGYDPRKREVALQARMYQNMDYRVNRKLFDLLNLQIPSTVAIHAASTPMKRKDLITTSAATNATAQVPSLVVPHSSLTAAQLDLHFSRLPTRLHTTYQIIDLGADIVAVAEQSELIEPCNKDTGWFKIESLNRIRGLMNARMLEWCGARGLDVTHPDITTILTPEERSKKLRNKGRRTLGRAFAIERNKARGMMTVRKPRVLKKKTGEEGGVGEEGATKTTPAKKKQKKGAATSSTTATTVGLDHLPSILNESLQAASAVAAAAMENIVRNGGASGEEEEEMEDDQGQGEEEIEEEGDEDLNEEEDEE